MAGRDLAELGIKVDASGAIATVNTLGASLDATAGKAQKFTITAAQSDEAWKRSGGSISAFNTIVGQMKSQWESANAVAEQATRTMNTQAEAARGLAQASTPAGRAMALMEVEAYKMDASMGKSALSVNRLRESVTSMAASALQAAPGLTQFTSILGAQALGGAVMVGVLGGLAAVSAAYNVLTKDAREAAEAQDKAVASLKEWYRIQGLGAAGKFADDVEKATARLATLRERLAALTKQSTTTALGESGLAQRGDAKAQADKVRAEYQELTREIEAGEAHIADVRKKAADASLAETVRNTATLVQAHNLSKNELANVAALKAEIERRLGDLTKAGGSQGDRAQLIAQLNEINEALHPKAAAAAAARDEKRELKELNDERERAHRLALANIKVELQSEAAGNLKKQAEDAKEMKDALAGVAAQYERIRAAQAGRDAVKRQNDIEVAAQEKYVADLQAIWREGAGRIAADFAKSFSRGFEEVYSLFVKLMKRMEDAKKTSGIGYQALGLGASAIGGGLAGYQTGSAEGGAAAGALAGSAFGLPGAIVGGFAGAVAGLFGAAQKQKEAAAALEAAAQRQFDDFKAGVADYTRNPVASLQEKLDAELARFNDLKKQSGALGYGSEDGQYVDKLTEAYFRHVEAIKADMAAEEAATARITARREEDAALRLLAATDGPAYEAARIAAEHRREIEDLVTAKASEATIALTEQAQAAEDVARATAAATAAMEKAAQQARAVEDINVELLRAKGDTSGADAMEFQLSQQRRLEDAQKNQSAEYVQKLLELQQLQRDSRAAQALIDSTGVQPGGGGGGAGGATSVSAAFSATVTERTGLALLDIGRTHTSLLRQIATNTRGLSAYGGAGSIDVIDDGLGTKAEHDKLLSGSVSR